MITPEMLTQIGLSSALFILLWVVLGNLFFKPFIALIEEREARTSGADQKTAELRRENKDVEVEIETLLRDARRQGMEQRDQQVLKAKAEALQILQAAQQKVAAKLEAGRGEIQTLSAAAEKQLAGEVDQLSSLVLNQLLAEDVQRTVH